MKSGYRQNPKDALAICTVFKRLNRADKSFLVISDELAETERKKYGENFPSSSGYSNLHSWLTRAYCPTVW